MKEKRDPKTVTTFFQRRDDWRRRLLASEVVQRKPRLFLLGYVLSERFDWEKFDCFPERETIAAEIGVSATQVSALTKELSQLGFMRIKRRRNASSVYVGTIPQEVKCSSHPNLSESGANKGLNVKSSPIRKSSGLHIGKSSAADANVIRNVDYNVGGGAPAPAALYDGLKYSKRPVSDVSENVSVALSPVAPWGAGDALVTLPENKTLDEFVADITRNVMLPPSLTIRLRQLLQDEALTGQKLTQILALGDHSNAQAKQ